MGFFWREHIEAYAQTGCPSAAHRTKSITDREPAGPGVAADTVLIRKADGDTSQDKVYDVR